MPTKLVTDQPKLKTATRFAKAVNTLKSLAGGNGADKGVVTALEKVIATSLAAKTPLPSEDDCANLPGCLRTLNRQFKSAVALKDSEVKLADECKYKDHVIRVYERLDVGDRKCRYQPCILKDGKEVHNIHVRSKTAYVSREHFAKRAVDHMLATGSWPAKQGLPLPK